MRSGELARLAGVSADTLHHYEKLGLLTPSMRDDNGYRHYEPGALQRVELIQKALRLGFTLGELAPILKERDFGGAPCKSVRRLAAAKLVEIDERLLALHELRTQFAEMLAKWDQTLSGKGDQPARLLEKIPDLPATALATRFKRKARSKS